MNLTVNARDAMPSGGRLTIETSNVVLDSAEIDSGSDLTAGSYVKLLVTDTGHGIAEHLQCKIFEPFFTTKGAGKGTGLGLAVVHGVMKQCGGHIAVSSIEDRGTTFDLLFPVAKEAVSLSTPAPARIELPATETVLLVEDNDSVRNIARIALHAHGFNVIEAESAASALSLVDSYSSPIHLLISDVVMPQMGGQQLAEIIRTRHPGLPVLYISGHSDLALHTDEPGGRQEAFLQKPFTPTSLVRKVRSILMKSESRPSHL
jgi:CheY-like chemotaxis protein